MANGLPSIRSTRARIAKLREELRIQEQVLMLANRQQPLKPSKRASRDAERGFYGELREGKGRVWRPEIGGQG